VGFKVLTPFHWCLLIVLVLLQEDAQELADPVRIAKLIKQYSQFIQFPIKLYAPSREAKQVLDDEATQKRQEEADKALKEGEEQKKVMALTGFWRSAGI
jgi:heat shock protein beta